MKAMILAAGLGSRLGDITQSKPKCLVEVHGKTLLEHAVDRLRETGVTSLVINTHHFADQVADYIRQRQNFGMTVHLSHEPELLETGGGLYKARTHFAGESEFMVCNADVYHRLDLAAALEEHRHRRPVATLLVMARETKRYLVFDSDNQLVGRVDSSGESTLLRDAPVQNLLAFSGLQVLSPRIFEFCAGLPDKFSIIEAYLGAVKAGAMVRAFPVSPTRWSDVGTPERLQALRNAEPY